MTILKKIPKAAIDLATYEPVIKTLIIILNGLSFFCLYIWCYKYIWEWKFAWQYLLDLNHVIYVIVLQKLRIISRSHFHHQQILLLVESHVETLAQASPYSLPTRTRLDKD